MSQKGDTDAVSRPHHHYDNWLPRSVPLDTACGGTGGGAAWPALGRRTKQVWRQERRPGGVNDVVSVSRRTRYGGTVTKLTTVQTRTTRIE